jgi:hypothetical protein
MTEHDSKPLRCRTGHHAWVETRLTSGEIHRHCSRCGEDEYDVPAAQSDASNVLGSMAQGFGGSSTGG